jgi:small subunit ribosomal protein S17
MEPKSTSRKKIVGLVIKDKMDKTVVVEVEKRFKHGMYQKYLSTKTRCKAHDEQNAAHVGDQVLLVETRPLSKEKKWVVKEIIKKAMVVPALEVSAQ